MSAVGAASALAASGIPSAALEAYVRAADAAPARCHIAWTLVAAIGRVESNHGRFAGAVLHTDGRSTPPIIGIALDGVGTALIHDTDGGRLDGDPVYDRAVGPMQFIPSTWRIYAGDGDGDGRSDPFDIYDAAVATANYLCAAGGDLASVAGQMRAVLAYNHSNSYVATVLTLAASYAGTPPPHLPTPSTVPVPSVPPANPAQPPAIDAGPPPATGLATSAGAPASTSSTATSSAAAVGAPPPASAAPAPTDPTASSTSTTTAATAPPTTAASTTVATTSTSSTTVAPTTVAPTTVAPTTVAPTTVAPTTVAPTTSTAATVAPTTVAPTTVAPTTVAPTTVAPTTAAPTTSTAATVAPTTSTAATTP